MILGSRLNGLGSTAVLMAGLGDDFNLQFDTSILARTPYTSQQSSIKSSTTEAATGQSGDGGFNWNALWGGLGAAAGGLIQGLQGGRTPFTGAQPPVVVQQKPNYTVPISIGAAAIGVGLLYFLMKK